MILKATKAKKVTVSHQFSSFCPGDVQLIVVLHIQHGVMKWPMGEKKYQVHPIGSDY